MTSPSPALKAAAIALILALAACAPVPALRVADRAAAGAPATEGKGLLEQGRAVEAIAAFRAQLRRDGPSVQALNGLAIAYAELGRGDLAAETFGRALALAPDDPTTLNNIGFAALRRAEPTLARRYLERARAENSGHEEIAGNLKRLALLEQSAPRRAGPPASPKPAALSLDRRTASIVRLAGLPKAPDASSSKPKPKPAAAEPAALGSRSPAADAAPGALIDFTTVADPFEGGPIGGRTRP